MTDLTPAQVAQAVLRACDYERIPVELSAVQAELGDPHSSGLGLQILEVLGALADLGRVEQFSTFRDSYLGRGETYGRTVVYRLTRRGIEWLRARRDLMHPPLTGISEAEAVAEMRRLRAALWPSKRGRQREVCL